MLPWRAFKKKSYLRTKLGTIEKLVTDKTKESGNNITIETLDDLSDSFSNFPP
jgi:hypothetical protein